jgi:decaprenyl-phosphate phosphoribosyltransferase
MVDEHGALHPNPISLVNTQDVHASPPTQRGSGTPAPATSSATPPAPDMRKVSLGFVRALRPKQWVKNLLVFVAPAVAGVLFHDHQILRAIAAFGIFCAAASGLYLINDASDAEADRLHPLKRHRPIASGILHPQLAIAAGIVLIAAALAGSWLLAGWQMLVVIALYEVITVAYTVRLKLEPVIELAAVASGFVLRAVGGGVATHVPLSSWFLVVVSFAALFVVTGKRAAEYQHLGDGRDAHRPVLAEYTPSFLQATLTMTTAVTVTAYCLWAFERSGVLARPGVHFVWIQLTVAPIVICVLHVLRLLMSGKGGAPEDLAFSDHLVQLLAVITVGLFAIGIYA